MATRLEVRITSRTSRQSARAGKALALALAAILVAGSTVSGRHGPGAFGNLSDRAGAVLITMIGEAGQRGTDFIDVNDLVIALIAEDQDARAPELFEQTPPGTLFPPGLLFPPSSGKEHEPLFSPRVAVDILIKLNQVLPRSTSIPPGTDQETSPALDRVMTVANNLPSQFHQSEVQKKAGTRDHPPGMYQAVVPLDLLAAALQEPCEATHMLQEVGVTEEKVVTILRSGGDLENGSFHL